MMPCRLCAILLVSIVLCCQAFTIPQYAAAAAAAQRSISRLQKPLHGSYFDDEDEDDREFDRIRRGGRRSRTITEEEEMLDELEDVVDDYYNDADDDDDDDFQGLIPNPLLDNIDPEGSAERFGELLTDRQFWIDIGLLLLFLNFLDNLRDPAVFDAIDMATM
jgi:hypothetical protein